MSHDKIEEKHRDENVLLVTHGDIGKMIYVEYYGLDWKAVLTQFHCGNCDILLMSEDSTPMMLMYLSYPNIINQ